jgi:hypothetical protein
MKVSYTALKLPRMLWERHPLSERSLAVETNAIFLVGHGQPVRSLPYGAVLHERIRRHRYSESSTDPLLIDLPNDVGTRLALGYVDESETPFAALTRARKLLGIHRETARLCVGCFGISEPAASRALKAILAAALSERAAMPDFRRSKGRAEPRLAVIRMAGPDI